MLSEKTEEFETILNYGTRLFFNRKSVIYEQETNGDGFYFIRKGLVKIFTSTSKGNERLLDIVFPGQVLGIQAMDENHYGTTAITEIDSVLYFFTREEILKLIRLRPESMNMIHENIIRNTRELIQNIYMDTLDARQRISFFILKYFNDLKKNKVFLTQQDLVKSTGLTRVTVYKTLKEWKREGIIDMKERKVVIKRPDLLRSIF